MLMSDEPTTRTAHGNNNNNDNLPTQPKYTRLKYLLKQTTAYSKFLADKLSKQDLASIDDTKTTINTIDEMKTTKELFSQPQLMTGGRLRPFQLEGVEWLVSLYENGLNGILADEMGLGKTVQCIGFLAFLCERQVAGPFLVVAPLSTLRNWESEFKRFTPSIDCVVYHGDDRRQQQRHITTNHQQTVVITNYETVIKDNAFFRRFTWKYLVIDEGHRIKNVNCRLVRELTKLRSLNRLLLTGTPLQNNIAELWSLLHFLLPDLFDDLASFESWFDFDCDGGGDGDRYNLSAAQERHLITSLHDILKPFLLRRLKADVLVDSLPAKREYIVRCPPTRLQQDMLKALHNHTLRLYVSQHCHHASGQRLQGDTMQARKICNDPRLFEHKRATSQDSAKMIILDQLIRLFAPHKVLIFSQMAKMLDVIEDHLSPLTNVTRWCRIDGAVSEPDRQSAIAAFNTDPACRLFLLTTRSAGLGLNLTAARFAILYDLDWNPQADHQAASRLHRIGQPDQVVVVRLRVAGSVEDDRMAAVAARKERLERRVISRRRFKGRQEYLKDAMDGASIDDNIDDTHHPPNMPTRSTLNERELEALLDPSIDISDSDMLIPFHSHSTLLDAHNQ